MDNTETKPCRMCRKDIPSFARKCPFCHHMQTATGAFLHNPAGQMVIGALLAAVGLVFLVFFGNRVFDREGRGFDEFKSQVTITDSHTAFGETRGEPVVTIIGTIQNRSPVSWTYPLIEITFRDADGSMTDAKQVQGPNLVPHTTNTPFSVSIPRFFPEARYGAHEVRILTATEARKGFAD